MCDCNINSILVETLIYTLRTHMINSILTYILRKLKRTECAPFEFMDYKSDLGRLIISKNPTSICEAEYWILQRNKKHTWPAL